MNRFAAATLLLTLSVQAPALNEQKQAVAPGKSVENGFSISLTMFTTLAAINAAGYDAGLDSPLNQRFRLRTQVREEIAKRNPPSLPDLRAFYVAHKKPNDTGTLSQYISFSLLAGDAPQFELPKSELPADVEALRTLTPLLVRFYKEADIEGLWNRSQGAYAAAVRDYQDAVIGTLFEANGYLRNPSDSGARRFQIFLDLLSAPDQVQVRSYRSDYFIVISPTSTPIVGEIRDAYLTYLLDPLTFKYSSLIKEKKDLAKYADNAPALDLAYKDDFSLLVTKSLIKALDSRLNHASREAKAAEINQAMAEGFVLTAAFADLLPAYEKQLDSFRSYYPDLVSAIDVRKEEKRLKNVHFAQSAAPRVIAPPARMRIAPAEESLQTAEGLLEQKDFENAGRSFKRVLGETSEKPYQSRAFYGLGIIALGEKHWDEAVNLFGHTIEADPNSPAAGWSHYYLGQLELKTNEPGKEEKAESQFRSALATAGLSARAREATEKALENLKSGDKQQ